MTPPPKEPTVTTINALNDLIMAQFEEMWHRKMVPTHEHPEGDFYQVAIIPAIGDLMALKKALGCLQSSQLLFPGLTTHPSHHYAIHNGEQIRWWGLLMKLSSRGSALTEQQPVITPSEKASGKRPQILPNVSKTVKTTTVASFPPPVVKKNDSKGDTKTHPAGTTASKKAKPVTESSAHSYTTRSRKLH
ncbi:hypothetical protein MSAN_00944100 [Mycena sanguinolenta]|uniref:Uncharacterized protein n=1 Tax=Mycena sanguinolenta TaxID=230812 RepID=A0A8H6YTF7_9AGAR|nr:hypothetical protein MSAN_00944100 [Mycena sanguinolenta]